MASDQWTSDGTFPSSFCVQRSLARPPGLSSRGADHGGTIHARGESSSSPRSAPLSLDPKEGKTYLTTFGKIRVQHHGRVPMISHRASPGPEPAVQGPLPTLSTCGPSPSSPRPPSSPRRMEREEMAVIYPVSVAADAAVLIPSRAPSMDIRSSVQV